MKPSEREYTGVLQYFHNYEHDPEGRTHCTGLGENAYSIEHIDGKHKITTKYAKGHGRRDIQWFLFHKKLRDGYDMSSAEKVEPNEVVKSQIKPTPKGLREYRMILKMKDHHD